MRIMRVVKHYKSALSRQVGEAVRIRRRGGAGMILNSKSEFNRCRIPRLIIEEVDEEQTKEQEERELREAIEQLDECERAWENQRSKIREQELREARSKVERIEQRVGSKKREQEQNKTGVESRKKKLRYNVEEESWGVDLESSLVNGSSTATSTPPGSSTDTPTPRPTGSSQELDPGSSHKTTEAVGSSPELEPDQGSSSNTTAAPGSSSMKLTVQKKILDFALPQPLRPADKNSPGILRDDNFLQTRRTRTASRHFDGT